MKSSLRKPLQWFLLILCAGFIVQFFNRNREELLVVLEIRPTYVVSLLALCSVYLILHAYRYQVVLEKCSDRQISFGSWFRLFILGRFLNSIFPQAGNVYRSVRLKENYGVTYTRYISACFSLVWMATCFNLLLTLGVIMLANPGLRVGSLPAKQLVLVSAVLFGALPPLVGALLRVLPERGYLSWLRAKLTEVLQVSVRNLRDGWYMARIIVAGVLVFGQACLIIYMCFQSMGIGVGAAEAVLFYSLLQLSTYVNFTPGNIGVQEIVLGLLAEAMEIGMGAGMLVSGLLRAVNYMLLLILGAAMGGLGLVRQSEHYTSRDGRDPRPEVEFERGAGLE